MTNCYLPLLKSFIASGENGSNVGIWQLGDHTEYPFGMELFSETDDARQKFGSDTSSVVADDFKFGDESSIKTAFFGQ